MGKSTPGRGAAQQGWIVLAELPLHVTEDVRSSSTFLAFWNRRQTPTLGVVCRQIAKQIQYIGHIVPCNTYLQLNAIHHQNFNKNSANNLLCFRILSRWPM
jgi:hypothetical protein